MRAEKQEGTRANSNRSAHCFIFPTATSALDKLTEEACIVPLPKPWVRLETNRWAAALERNKAATGRAGSDAKRVIAASVWVLSQVGFGSSGPRKYELAQIRCLAALAKK